MTCYNSWCRDVLSMSNIMYVCRPEGQSTTRDRVKAAPTSRPSSSSLIGAGLRHDPSLGKGPASRLLFRWKEIQLHWESFSNNEAELLRFEGGRADEHRSMQLARLASIQKLCSSRSRLITNCGNLSREFEFRQYALFQRSTILDAGQHPSR